MRGFVGLLQLECVQRGDADDEELSVADDDDYCIRSSGRKELNDRGSIQHLW